MKRLLAFLLAIVLCFSLIACQREDKKDSQKADRTHQSQKEEKEQTNNDSDTKKEEEDDPQKKESQITPLLYKVTDDKGNTVWLFGSIHVGQEHFYPLPDYVEDAFTGADALAVEADIVAFEKNLKAQMEALSILVYADASTIDEHIPAELYDRAVEALEELGFYSTALDYYCPYLWADTINSSCYQQMGVDFSLGIDRHLLNWAKEEKMPIYEIESAEFQYGMMAGFSDELQVYLLESALEGYEDPALLEEDLEDMLELWTSGDETAFKAYLSEEGDIPPEEAALYEEYNRVMITDRNIGMTDYAEAALASGEEVFICVGAAHVVGAGAMADLLSQRGYTVELVH